MHSFSLLQGKCTHSVFCRVTECSEALCNVVECFFMVTKNILIMTLKLELEWSIP